MQTWFDDASRWIVYTYFEASELFSMLDAGYDDSLLRNNSFWNDVWNHFEIPKYNNNPSSRGHVLQLMLTDAQSINRNRIAIRVLCRTQLTFSAKTSCLGHWARSYHLFEEADRLFALQKTTQKVLVSSKEKAISIASTESNILHGTVKFDRTHMPFLFNALSKKFEPYNQITQIYDLKNEPIDCISPLIENPFVYYKDFIVNTHTVDKLLFLLVVLFPSIHRVATEDLFVWYLTQQHLDYLIPFLEGINYAKVSRVAWCSEDAPGNVVLINFGFRLEDYLKLEANLYVDGEIVLNNPFDYIRFYVRDTNMKCVRVHTQIDAQRVIYKGAYITLRTHCKAIEKTWDLSICENQLTLEQFVHRMWDLYSHTLSQEEYNSVLEDRRTLADAENYRLMCKENPQGHAAFHHFIWNHHNVTGLQGTKFVFTCVVEELN